MPRELAEEAAGLIRSVLGAPTRIWWFGSWVRGTAVPRSDIDLAVDAGRSLEASESARLREVLDSLSTLRGIDLVDLHALNEIRREAILREGIEL